MSWDSLPVSDEDSLELLEERRKACKALISLHSSELHRWEGLKAKVETAIQMKSLKNQIAKTPKPTVAEADLLDYYKKLVDSTGKQAPKPEAKAETKEAKVETKTESQSESKPAETKTPAPAPAAKPAEPATKPAEPAAKPAEPAAKPEEKPAEPAPKPAEPAAKPAEPAAKPAEPAKAAEPEVKPAEVKPTEATKVESDKSQEAKSSEAAKPTDEAKADALQPAEPEERLSMSFDEPTNLGALGNKPRMRGSTSRAHPTLKKDPLVFTPTVVAPSQSEMEEMEKKRAAEDKKPEGTDPSPAKSKKVQPVGFNPLLGLKPASGPALKYDKCNDCSCNDFSPDTFKKGKCTNCFHIHPVSKDAPPSPALAPTSPSSAPEEEEEQPPPPTTPFPGIPKTPDTKPEPRSPGESRTSMSEPPRSPGGYAKMESLRSIPADEALKPPGGEGRESTSSPNAKKMVGAKGFDLGLSPTEASTEPVVKCKDCGCEDFSPDPFKKTKCSNCFHIHSGAPPPPKTGARK